MHAARTHAHTRAGAQKDQLYVNPLSSSSAHLRKFHFVGLFMAKAIIESAARGRCAAWQRCVVAVCGVAALRNCGVLHGSAVPVWCAAWQLCVIAVCCMAALRLCGV